MKTLGCLLLAATASAQPLIHDVHVVNSPNVLTWPITTHIQRIEVTDAGVRVAFDKCESWPKVTPPGWDGPLSHTLWLFLNIGGEWYGSGVIQFWACDQFNGGPIYQDDQIARNWVYDNRWSSMVRHQPAPGERIGFMVSAGNARGQDDHGVMERSDIVEVAMPSGPMVYPPFLASEAGGFPTPAPPVPPVIYVPPPAPAPLPSTDLTPILMRLDALSQQLAAHEAADAAERVKADAFRQAVASKWADFGKLVAKYVPVIVAAFYGGKKL